MTFIIYPNICPWKRDHVHEKQLTNQKTRWKQIIKLKTYPHSRLVSVQNNLASRLWPFVRLTALWPKVLYIVSLPTVWSCLNLQVFTLTQILHWTSLRTLHCLFHISKYTQLRTVSLESGKILPPFHSEDLACNYNYKTIGCNTVVLILASLFAAFTVLC